MSVLAQGMFENFKLQQEESNQANQDKMQMMVQQYELVL